MTTKKNGIVVFEGPCFFYDLRNNVMIEGRGLHLKDIIDVPAQELSIKSSLG